MRISTRRLTPTLALWALLVSLSGLSAQEKPKAEDAPKAKAGTLAYAFFSSSAEFNLTAEAPKAEPTYMESITTRLNTENQLFAYVHNPSDRDLNVNVYLQAGDSKSRSLLAQTVASVELKAKETRKVSLVTARATPVAPPPAVAAPAAGEKAKDGEPEVFKPRGDKLPAGAANLYLRVVPAAAKLDVLGTDAEQGFNINAKAPDGFTATATATNQTVAVEVTYKATAKRLSNAPVKVRLDLRPDLNPRLDATSALEGTFVAELPALNVGEEATATLVAKNLKFNPINKELLTFGVTIDGYDRAYLFETAIDGTKPTEIGNKALAVTNVRLSTYAQVPGKPVTITVEADGSDDKPVELLVNRLSDGTPTEVLRKFPASRSREVYLAVGEEGAVALTPVVKDWAVEFPTAQVAGKRAFAVRVAGTDSKPQVLIVDRTPPEGVEFTDRPKKESLLVASEHTLSAVGKDGDSGIDKVYFFTGETPPGLDGKPAAGSRVIPGVPVAGKPGTYKSKEPFRLPETKGELRLGVVYFNKVGLSTPADLTVYVSTPPLPKEKPTTGSIIGRAVQAGRPQPGLPVTLSDAAGKVLKETKSDDVGKFEFKELAPGNYTVVAVKRADANASGKATVEVKAAKEPTQIPALVIKR